jgi:farnesyl diphosphate synthase
LGAVCAPCPAGALRALSDFGAAIGLAFQVVDDVLDVTQASEVLGKTAGKDVEQNKPTYVQLMGLQRARDYALELRAQARDALAGSGLTSTQTLSMLADKVVDREN